MSTLHQAPVERNVYSDYSKKLRFSLIYIIFAGVNRVFIEDCHLLGCVVV
jgi:hypothetical protein